MGLDLMAYKSRLRIRKAKVVKKMTGSQDVAELVDGSFPSKRISGKRSRKPTLTNGSRVDRTVTDADSSKIPKGLTPDEEQAYRALLAVQRSRGAAGVKPRHVLVVSDLAKDYDDLAAMVVLKELHRLKIIHLEGFVANLLPAAKRAAFGRGALDSLKLEDVPIAVGLPAMEKLDLIRNLEHSYEFQCSFMAPEGSVKEKGQDLMQRLCKTAIEKEEKLTLVCLSSLADIGKFSQMFPKLLRNALHDVVLQGGYRISPEGHIVPDDKAANNRIHFSLSKVFHAFMEENQIPSLVFDKEASFGTPITTELFKEMAATNHPVGQHLNFVQSRQDLAFYERACMPNPEDRFAPHLDQDWFLRNKSSWYESKHPPGTPLPVGDEVLPYLTKVIVYDALAALGAGGNDVLIALEAVHGPIADGKPELHGAVGNENATSGVNGAKMATALSALLKGSLLAVQQGLS